MLKKKKKKFPKVSEHEFKGQSGKMLKGMCTVLERLLGFELTEIQQ